MDDQDRGATKRPSHIAYQVREGREGQAYYNRVGAAFAHQDGLGFNIVLDAAPLDGRLTLRTPQEVDAAISKSKRNRERQHGESER